MSATRGHSGERVAAVAGPGAPPPPPARPGRGGGGGRLGPVRAVAVDGPAGAGKTTFADRLADAIRATGMQVAEIHTDDLLDGWSDAITYWPRLADWVLDPLRRGETASYRRYDWVARR